MGIATLDRYPGLLFIGKVKAVIAAAGGGQLAPGGNIPTVVQSTGAATVKIVLNGPAVARKLSIGLGEREPSTPVSESPRIAGGYCDSGHAPPSSTLSA